MNEGPRVFECETWNVLSSFGHLSLEEAKHNVPEVSQLSSFEPFSQCILKHGLYVTWHSFVLVDVQLRWATSVILANVNGPEFVVAHTLFIVRGVPFHLAVDAT